MTDAAATTETKSPLFTDVPLDKPIERAGGQKIDSLRLRKPDSGEMRGLALTDLLKLDVAALIKLLPRIAMPTITEQEAAKLDPADLTSLGSEVVAFLLTRQQKAEAFLEA